MLKKCQWCGTVANGYDAISDHERSIHPVEYWEHKAAAALYRADQYRQESERYSRKAQEARANKR